MKIKFTLFSIILFLFCTVSAQAQTNLVVNGSFEEVEDGKPVGWSLGTTGGAIYNVMDAEDAQAGAKVLHVIAGSGSSGASISRVIEGITAGEKYKISLYYNIQTPPTSTSGGIRIGYRWQTATGSNIGNLVYFEYFNTAISEIWLSFETAEIEAPENASKLFLGIVHNYGVNYYIDDVQLVAEGEVITGLSAAKAAMLQAQLSVRVENGNLVVSGAPEGSRIDVYSLVGNRLQSAVAAQGETVLSGLPKNQVLIVRNGNKVAKVVVK